ncbi:MAG: hypothetical protein QW080_04205 [Sulfolobales archaeon]
MESTRRKVEQLRGNEEFPECLFSVLGFCGLLRGVAPPAAARGGYQRLHARIMSTA